MKAAIENEIKLHVESAAEARSLLRRAGFIVTTPRVFEQNLVLDDGRGSLRERDMLLRLRAAGKIVTCSFKGPPTPARHKRREEREFQASNFDSCIAVFAALGFSEVFRYEKYRTEFKRLGAGGKPERGLATLDETPIGNYIELEGPAGWVDRIAKLLGSSRTAYITASYSELFGKWRESMPLAPANMRFSRR